jgi:hypothetical protein
VALHVGSVRLAGVRPLNDRIGLIVIMEVANMRMPITPSFVRAVGDRSISRTDSIYGRRQRRLRLRRASRTGKISLRLAEYVGHPSRGVDDATREAASGIPYR